MKKLEKLVWKKNISIRTYMRIVRDFYQLFIQPAFKGSRCFHHTYIFIYCTDDSFRCTYSTCFFLLPSLRELALNINGNLTSFYFLVDFSLANTSSAIESYKKKNLCVYLPG